MIQVRKGLNIDTRKITIGAKVEVSDHEQEKQAPLVRHHDEPQQEHPSEQSKQGQTR
jgi:hypothetical protein